MPPVLVSTLLPFRPWKLGIRVNTLYWGGRNVKYISFCKNRFQYSFLKSHVTSLNYVLHPLSVQLLSLHANRVIFVSVTEMLVSILSICPDDEVDGEGEEEGEGKKQLTPPPPPPPPHWSLALNLPYFNSLNTNIGQRACRIEELEIKAR